MDVEDHVACVIAECVVWKSRTVGMLGGHLTWDALVRRRDVSLRGG